METWNPGNSNLAELLGLEDERFAPDNGATVVLTDVEDDDGVTVAGPSYPLTMANFTPTAAELAEDIPAAGNYRGIVVPALAIVKGRYYTAIITATGASGSTGIWRKRLVAADRPT